MYSCTCTYLQRELKQIHFMGAGCTVQDRSCHCLYRENIQVEVTTPIQSDHTKDQISSMIENGLEVISCGANVPFADKEIFFGSIMEYTDSRVSLIPDFISNCGMARVFAYFMERKVLMTDQAIFNDTSQTIKKAIEDTYNANNSKTNISKTASQSFSVAPICNANSTIYLPK